MSDQPYELADSLLDRLKYAIRRYEQTLELAEVGRIAVERAREDLDALTKDNNE